MGDIKGEGGKDDAVAPTASHGISIVDQRTARRTRPWDEEFGTTAPTEDAEAKPENEWSRGGRGNTAASSASARGSSTFAVLDIYHDLSEGTLHVFSLFLSLLGCSVRSFHRARAIHGIPWSQCSVPGTGRG